jgi:alkyl sulfatase BDS1-like metallo-beta-lactamase superfamily hydrolase
MKKSVGKSFYLCFARLAFFALVITINMPVEAAERGGATELTQQFNAAIAQKLPFHDRQDFEDAARGLVATAPAVIIRDSDGSTVWDMTQYDFLKNDSPLETINPSLHRQATLNNLHGLFKVNDRIYQVRGYDLANMGIIIGDKGYIIIDPLTSIDTARAAMRLVYDHLGKKPIIAVIYSHSHADHWSGVKGIISEQDVKTGKVKVIAPAGFMKDAVSENVYAGNAMMRRAQYMYGALLPRGARGQVDAGLGKSLPSVISSSLIPPTNSVLKSGQEITVDGVRIVFQLTPGTEAPANMNFHFPQLRTLFMADNCVATLHNLLTPRGSQIRDAKAWAGFIYEALDLFADESDVVILGHTWPRWGKERIINFLSKQAAAYKYIHDQTLRLANQGYTMREIAEQLQLPETLPNDWFNRDYYATVGWNAKAVYQYYLGWYDGNPANFNPLPPVEASKKYVEYMGGADLVLSKASEAFEKGEYRWVAQVLNHVVFAEPENERARLLQADALEQLGYQSESAVFRNFYLFGAQELRHGVKKPRGKMSPPLDVVQALTPDMIFDSMAVRLNGPKAKGKAITINWYFSDTNERYILYLDNSVLNHIAGRQSKSADCSIEIRRDLFNKVIAGQTTFPARILLGQIKYQGSIKKLSELMALLDDPEPFFNIVTP